MWDATTDSLAIKCLGSNATTTVSTMARCHIIHTLRMAINYSYKNCLLSKRDQGKVFEVTMTNRVSNYFTRNGSFTRFADWRFMFRARLDVLPFNAYLRWLDAPNMCRECGELLETLPHVLNHCGKHSPLRQRRHNAIQNRLVKATHAQGSATGGEMGTQLRGQGPREADGAEGEGAKSTGIITFWGCN